MDFTNPAGRLHLSQATLHPLVLEYFQGMLHLHTKNIYCALLNSAHARVVWEKKQTSSCLLSAGLNQRQTCLITFIAVKSDPKLISSATHISVEELDIPFWLPVFCCL